MMLDALAVFADAQADTLSAASTDVVDTLAAGDSYEGAWLNVRIDTAYAVITGSPTNTFQLQTAPDSTFNVGAVTLAQSAALLYTDMVANEYVWKVRIPPGAKRWLRVYKVTTTSGGSNYFFNAGKFDAFITLDIDKQKVLA